MQTRNVAAVGRQPRELGLLHYTQGQSFEILAFRVMQTDRMIDGMAKLSNDRGFSSGIGGRTKDHFLK
jgi:hypothetical protein